jgi:acetyl esterase/lipase
VLLIHGGGWVKGSPQAYYFLARPLRDMGLSVACLEYRLYDKEATPPVSVIDAVADAQDAMRYLRAHANELAIDPDRIIACGGSAGAHLAAGLALFDDQSGANDPAAYQPAALVLFNPVIDTSREGFGYGKLKENWEAFSPLHRLEPGLPPTIIFHGTGDQTVPYAGPVAFTEKAQANGDVCVLVTNEGGDHGFYMKQPVRDQTMARTRQFLQEQGLLNAVPETGNGIGNHP